MIKDFFELVNPYAWIGSNILIAYIAVVLLVFLTGYYALHDPKATTAGRFVFRFILSLVGVIGLVFVSVFIDPRMGREWYVYPPDVYFWRPVARFIVYTYVAYAVTALAVLIVVRRWYPEKLKTAEDRRLLKDRNLGRN